MIGFAHDLEEPDDPAAVSAVFAHLSLLSPWAPEPATAPVGSLGDRHDEVLQQDEPERPTRSEGGNHQVSEGAAAAFLEEQGR
jgi:hypothetical protein